MPIARLVPLALVVARRPAASAAAAPRLDSSGSAVAGEAIVRFEPGTVAAERAEARDAADVELERTLELSQTQVVSFDGSLGAALTRLESRGDVAYAQPNYRYEALAPPPNDTFFGQLWGLGPDPGIGALAAWDRSRGAGQVIAIVDSGIDLSHPDLVPRLWRNPGEAPGGGDNDANGRGDDVYGYDFVGDGDSDPDDYAFHGTHVAGTAAAQAGNGIGVAGVAPEASLMAVRVLDGNGAGTSSWIGSGIVYAAQEGADVINLSLGGPAGAGDQFLSDSLAIARNYDAVVVAAAGNEGTNNDAQPNTPCTLPGDHLICVGALTTAGTLASFSNYGATTVDVAAPGVSILSTKTDFGPELRSEGFEDGLTGWNQLQQQGGVPWGISPMHTVGGQSAADSPNNSWYASNAYSEIHLGSDLNLTGRRGCRMHFDLRYDVLPGDFFDAGAFADADDGEVIVGGHSITGSSGGAFEDAEASISELDGQNDARPFFGLKSDGSGIADGVHLDELRVFCRDTDYVNAVAAGQGYAEDDAGNYVRFDGTSMAAPHVSGIAALVRAADPGASAAEVVRAIRDGATRRPTLAGRVLTGGSASAAGALDAALGVPLAVPAATAQPPAPTTRVRLLDLRGAPDRIRLKRSRRFTYPFRAAPGLRGRAVMRTRARVRVAARARRHLTPASERFRSPASGRVVLKIRLSRKELRVVRLNRRLKLRVRVSVTDSQGRVTRAARNLTLLPPR
jgi:subtilisin family serine protease